MSLYQKFEIGEVIRDDGVKSFQARDLTTGRQVQVHLIMGIPGRLPPPFELLDQLKQLPPQNRAHVLETGEQSGTPYVVTLPLEGFAGFRDWLTEKTGGTLRTTAVPPKEANPLSRVGRWKIPALGEPAPAAPPPPAPPPLDSTRVFGQPSLGIQRPAPVPPPVAPPPPPPVTAPQPTGQPLESTRIFGQPAASVPPPPPITAPQPVGQPLESTRIFGQTAAPMPPPPAPPPSEPARPLGEFTQAFEARRAAPPSVPAAEPYSDSAGEFTMAFGSSPFASTPPGSVPPAPVVNSEPSGEFTKAFTTPAFSPAAPAARPGPEPGEVTGLFGLPPGHQPPASKEPGEFTSAFSTPALSKTPPAAMPPRDPVYLPPQASAPQPSEEDTLRMFAAIKPPSAAPLPSSAPPLAGLGESAPALPPPLFGGEAASREASPFSSSVAGGDALQATRGFAVPSGAPRAGVPQPAAAGEYTRVYGNSPVPPPVPAAAAPAASSRKPVWIPVVLGVLIVLLLAGLIVTLLRK